MDEIKRISKLPKLAARNRDGHKGDYGHVLVVGGSRGMVGAVAMAAHAALRGGAGLATFAAPETIQLAAAAICPCATSIALACDESGELAAGAVRQVVEEAKKCDVIAVGPGFGAGGTQKNILAALLDQGKPLVIDADGLNNLSQMDHWPALRRCPLILTPHPGEFARLTGATTDAVQADREAAAVAAVNKWRAVGANQNITAGANQGRSPDNSEVSRPLVCVLKGAGTVVTDGEKIYINDTGNPGMATGGSGDILTGLTAALLGQGLSPFDAACLAVHAHGRAGDLAAKDLGEVSLIAYDLLNYLAQAMKESAAKAS